MSFQANMSQAALANTFFRKVLFTTPLTQVVVMHVNPGEDIGLEVYAAASRRELLEGVLRTSIEVVEGR